MNEFAKYHPLINFIYFTAVIVFSMIFVHPICLVTSLLCSVMYSIILNGKKALKFIVMLLPLMLISALINPAFNHEGVTVIAYLSVDVGIHTIRNCRGKYGCNGHLLVFLF